jgi:hypothetical protein
MQVSKNTRVLTHKTPISDDILPISIRRVRKLLDFLRAKMRSLHFAYAPEKAYRAYTVDLLHFQCDGEVSSLSARCNHT